MRRSAGDFEILITIISIIVLLVFPLGEFLPIIAYSQIPFLPNQQQQSPPPTEKNQAAIFNGGNINNNNNNNNKNKVAIITFGDAWKSEYTTAKPILDKYGFKASYFIPCNYPDLKRTAMTWQDIAALHNDGMDIASKGMNDILVTDLSASALDFEIGQSKQCFYNHGIDAIAFATPHGEGSNNATVVNTIAKYYNFAINGHSDLMFLHCNGWKHYSAQTDCRTFDDSGQVTFANRYVIREWAHNARDTADFHNDTQIFQQFVQEVNSQTKYNNNNNKNNNNNNNNNGTINAIPILAYHKIDDQGTPESTDIALFDAELKYLHDNGVRVITLSDLGYDENSNSLYIK